MRDHLRVTERRHGEEGQIFMALLVFGIVILAASLLLFQVGRAADLRAKGQTGADAAALAGARDVRTQFIILLIKSLVTGTPIDLDELLEPPACAEALAYAEQNNSTLTRCRLDKQQMEVTVAVVGNDSLGNSHEVPDGAKFARASATATAKVQILPDICGATGGEGIPGADSLPGLEGNPDCDFNGLPEDPPDFGSGDGFLGFLKIKLID